MTVTGITASNKTYNANTTATLVGLTSASLSGVFSGDAVTLGTSGAAGAFATKNVGNNITVTVTGPDPQRGAGQRLHADRSPPPRRTSRAAAVTVTGITASNKTYNANTTATLVGLTSASLSGVFTGDTVTLGTSGAAGAFATKNVGNNITVTVTGLTIGGAQASDYTLTQPTTAANITAAAADGHRHHGVQQDAITATPRRRCIRSREQPAIVHRRHGDAGTS